MKLDTAQRSVVTSCEDCPPWRTLHGTRPAALRAAAHHLELVHGAKAKAADLREQAARIDARHAD